MKRPGGIRASEPPGLGTANRGRLEAELHERLEAVLLELALLEAVPAAEAAAEAPRSDRHAEVRGGLGIGDLRHEAAAEVRIEFAVVVLVVEAELGAAEGVAGEQDHLVLAVVA